MRLTVQQVLAIKQAVSSVLGDESARITLFGSRLDDAAKGGDIDLLINTCIKQRNCASMASKIMAGLQVKLGDQHIDILLVDPATAILPIHEYAIEQGVIL
jgi:predicted nucleotidyltransferase